MPRKGGVPENLIKGKATQFNGETAAINGRKGALSKARNRTVAEWLAKWANLEVVDEDNKQLLKACGLDENATNSALLALPLIVNASKGDTKSIQMILELLGEDNKKEAEINKLKAETEKLKAEIQKLRAEVGEDREIEDLTPLGDMLKYETNKDD